MSLKGKSPNVPGLREFNKHGKAAICASAASCIAPLAEVSLTSQVRA